MIKTTARKMGTRTGPSGLNGGTQSAYHFDGGSENKTARPVARPGGRKNPAITYSRARRTTIGPGCLTVVFGMGTSVSIQVCPRESTWCSAVIMAVGLGHVE